MSIAKEVTSRCANFSTTFLFTAGYKNEMRVALFLRESTSLLGPSTVGARTFRRISLSDQTFFLFTILAPAVSYASSVNWASAPAPCSTRTRENPFLINNCAFCGVIATRFSFGYVSRAIPIVKFEYGVVIKSGVTAAEEAVERDAVFGTADVVEEAAVDVYLLYFFWLVG